MIGFSWVIDGELAGMGQPGLIDTLGEDLQALVDEGVGAVVTLTEQRLSENAVNLTNLDVLHVPIRDMMSPSRGDIDHFVAFAEESIADHKPVVVHCFAGRGRTGTMLACFMVHRGMNPAQAIGYIRDRRPGSIETDAQVLSVFDYARYLSEQRLENKMEKTKSRN